MYIKLNGYLQIIQIGPCYVFKPMDSPLLRNHLGKKNAKAKVLKNALANGVFLDLQNVTFAKPAAAWPRGIRMMEGVGKNSLLVR